MVVPVTAVMTVEQVRSIAQSLLGGAPSIISVFAGRIADTGRDPIPLMREALEVTNTHEHVELLWASPPELLNIIQADMIGCDIITATHEVLKKLGGLGKDLRRLLARDGEDVRRGCRRRRVQPVAGDRQDVHQLPRRATTDPSCNPLEREPRTSMIVDNEDPCTVSVLDPSVDVVSNRPPKSQVDPIVERFIDIGLLSCLAILTLTIVTGNHGPLRVILAFVFAMLTPGWLISGSLTSLSLYPRIVVSAATSIGMCTVATTLALWTGRWHPLAIFAIIGALCAVALVVTNCARHNEGTQPIRPSCRRRSQHRRHRSGAPDQVCRPSQISTNDPWPLCSGHRPLGYWRELHPAG